jgi:hypothetical protein
MFAGAQLMVVSSFRYLDVMFAAGQPLTAAVAPARTQAAPGAMAACNQRCTALRLVAAGVRPRLISTSVYSVIPHSVQGWALQSVAATGHEPRVAGCEPRAAGCSSRQHTHRGMHGSAVETLHMGYLRRLLGMRQATPKGAVLLKAGERPLSLRWLQHAGRLWNHLTASPPGSLLHAAFTVSCQLAAAALGNLRQARHSWAAQLAAALQGMPVDLAQPCRWSGRSSSSYHCLATSMRSRQQQGGPAPPSTHTT